MKFNQKKNEKLPKKKKLRKSQIQILQLQEKSQNRHGLIQAFYIKSYNFKKLQLTAKTTNSRPKRSILPKSIVGLGKKAVNFLFSW